jgi:SAM-dependent methyltransferase
MWQYWKDAPYYQDELRHRAEGKSPEMQSARQLSRLVASASRPDDNILDAGCGSGHYLNSLRRVIRHPFSYLGLDITPQHITAARQVFREQPNVQFLQGDVRTLPFPDSYFGITVCANTIPHIPQAARALRELVRVTSRTLLVRMLIGNEVVITKKALSDEMDAAGEPMEFSYVNIYTEQFVRSALGNSGASISFLDDEFDPEEMDLHFRRHVPDAGIQRATRIIDGFQAKNYLLLPWKVLKVQFA